MDELLTVAQVARLLGFDSSDKVRALIRAGRLAAINTATSTEPGRKAIYRIEPKAVQLFKSQSEVTTVAATSNQRVAMNKAVRIKQVAWRKRGA